MDFQQKKEMVKDFRPIDDTFFEVLINDAGVCEEILRTIMEDERLVVEEVIPQESIHSLYGRSVRLDALCTLGDGTKANIEVQRSDNDDHLKRARYNGACITASVSEPGTKFEHVPDVYVIYISQFDFLGEHKTTYHIDRVIRETGTVVDDGSHEIFVNTAVDDRTDIAELMACFMEKHPQNGKFPKLTERVYYLKEDEGGASTMCEVMEQYMEKSRREGRAEGQSSAYFELTRDNVLTPEQAADRMHISVDEFTVRFQAYLNSEK